jgi:enterochelin esterase-like enzyme
MIRRRALLLGLPASGAAAAAVVVGGIEAGALPGRRRLDRFLGLSSHGTSIPDVVPGPTTSGSFYSVARQAETGWTLVLPPGDHDRLPLVVALHARGGDHTSIVHDLAMPQFLAATVASGVPPFAVVGVDGGDTYWHPHHGTDSGAMVIDELVPLMAQRGLRTKRIGLYGWSMGGYGALRLGGLLGNRRAAGVAAASPALWVDGADASSAGFDDAAEYARYSVMGRQRQLEAVRVRIDVGRDDPFYSATRTYVAGFPAATHLVSTFSAGGHTNGFWRRMLVPELSFLGHALARPALVGPDSHLILGGRTLEQ